MGPVLQSHFSDYAAFHRTPGNKACHYLGIPMIVLTLLALLGRVPLITAFGFTVTLAEALLLASFAYYLTLDVALAVATLLLGVTFDAAGRFIPPVWALLLFVLGWVLQFVGHYVYEKQSPAFFRNLAHLLVGPLWILGHVLGRS